MDIPHPDRFQNCGGEWWIGPSGGVSLARITTDEATPSNLHTIRRIEFSSLYPAPPLTAHFLPHSELHFLHSRAGYLHNRAKLKLLSLKSAETANQGEFFFFYLRVNAFMNTQGKAASVIFSISYESTGVTLLAKPPDSHSKLPQQGDPYCCRALNADEIGKGVCSLYLKYHSQRPYQHMWKRQIIYRITIFANIYFTRLNGVIHKINHPKNFLITKKSPKHCESCLQKCITATKKAQYLTQYTVF